MALNEVNTKLANLALEHCEGFAFEEFACEFLAAIEGTKFTPIGGVSDGGADGAIDSGLYENGKTDVFFQMSTEENHRNKIKKTIDRLFEFGRKPKRLIYVTSRIVPTYDREEEELTDKYSVFIRIRDSKWIINNLNNSESTKKSYYTHLERYTDYLKDLSNGVGVRVNQTLNNPSVYVFLQQQLENRDKNQDLIKTLADSLIMWALNNTDPDKGVFMTRSELLNAITDNIPWAKNVVGGVIKGRLEYLSTKISLGGKKINHHTKGDKYCLPYETRQIIAKEKAEDEVLRIDVVSEICSSPHLSNYDNAVRNRIAALSLRTSELFFEREGLICSSFLNGQSEVGGEFIENTVADRVVEAIEEAGSKDLELKDDVCGVVKRMFYQSTQSQRLLLIKLSRTYVLLFSLQAEPRVVEYFQKATANFRLLVGTDLIIRAISERFLSKENQMTRNLFEMSKFAGIKLYLTEPALDAVVKHFIVTDNEYKNHIMSRESYLTAELIQESPQILIRTYYHARREGYSRNWSEFIGEFITYTQLHNVPGREEIRTYICQQFGMEFLSSEDLSLNTSMGDVESLSGEILELKKGNKSLADGVSLTINAVYGQRKNNKEASTFPEYGYQTWWLTQESRVQKHTANIVRKHGSKFIMRPEFLLNFFSMAPSVSDIRASYKTIFPSVMGIQIGNRLPDELFHQVLNQVDVWQKQDPGRVAAKTRMLCDRLKSEYYNKNLTGNSIDEALKDLT